MVHVVKESVAVAIRSVGADGAERVAAVLRPDVAGDPLGGLWGLPAASLRDNGAADDTVSRMLQVKLGLEGNQTQTMTVYAVMWDPDEPLPISLPSARMDSTLTLYDEWRWAFPSDLKEAASRGSLCARLYLEWLSRVE